MKIQNQDDYTTFFKVLYIDSKAKLPTFTKMTRYMAKVLRLTPEMIDDDMYTLVCYYYYCLSKKYKRAHVDLNMMERLYNAGSRSLPNQLIQDFQFIYDFCTKSSDILNLEVLSNIGKVNSTIYDQEDIKVRYQTLSNFTLASILSYLLTDRNPNALKDGNASSMGSKLLCPTARVIDHYLSICEEPRDPNNYSVNLSELITRCDYDIEIRGVYFNQLATFLFNSAVKQNAVLHKYDGKINEDTYILLLQADTANAKLLETYIYKQVGNERQIIWANNYHSCPMYESTARSNIALALLK